MSHFLSSVVDRFENTLIWLAFCRVSLIKIRRSSIFIYVNPCGSEALRLFLSQLSSNRLKLFGGGCLALLLSFRNSFINFYPNWTTTTKNTFCIEFFRDVLSDNASFFFIRHLCGYSNNFNILSKCWLSTPAWHESYQLTWKPSSWRWSILFWQLYITLLSYFWNQ